MVGRLRTLLGEGRVRSQHEGLLFAGDGCGDYGATLLSGWGCLSAEDSTNVHESTVQFKFWLWRVRSQVGQ